MPVKTFLFWLFSAVLCVPSASSVLRDCLNTEDAEGTQRTAEKSLYVRVNQLGFAPSAVKTAVVFAREPLPHDFRILNATTGAEVFRGSVNPVLGSWGQFDRHGELDFSAFKLQGSYVIEAGSARSPKFTINRRINKQIPDQLL